MKIMTVLGTRPEIIRLCKVIERLDQVCEHWVIHTGQNYDVQLSDIFFQQLRVRQPNRYLRARGTFGEQVATVVAGCEKLIRDEKPDKLLVLGDTNSGLSAFAAKRLGVPVYHMEAGNRCFDDRVPEEVNRRVIDSCSDVLMPYTERSRANLLREGVHGSRIFVTGNPIFEVIQHFMPQIENSTVLNKITLSAKDYMLVTLHRAENVENEHRLKRFAMALDLVQRKFSMPIIVSTHPHTKKQLDSYSVIFDNSNIHFLEPFGFFDFIKLEKNAFCVLSDSGTVQEECAILGVPNVTLRDVTERPETIECGCNILSGSEVSDILRCVDIVTSTITDWKPPAEYLVDHVSQIVVKILFGTIN